MTTARHSLGPPSPLLAWISHCLRLGRPRRPARHAREHAPADGGYGLIFVMVVTALIMIIVGTSMTLSTSNIRPSRATADSQAALAAAQAGIDEFAVALNACGVNLFGCEATAAPSTHDLLGAAGVVRATYSWTVLSEPDDNLAGVLRLSSVGQVRDIHRTLIADFRPTPNFLDYLYFTERETVSSATVRTYYGPRTVELPTSAIRAKATKVPPSTPRVTWTGAINEEICDQPWYDTDEGSGRHSLRFEYPANGHDYREFLTSPSGYPAERFADCEVSFGSLVTMDGKVYSKDALYLSNSVVGGQGPMFLDDVVTEWGTDKEPPPDLPGRWFRSNADVGGDPQPGSKFPQVASDEMSMPTTIDDLEAAATCVFTGPTRIRLVGSKAVVTSPLTDPVSLGSDCVPGDTPDGLVGTGLVGAEVPITDETVFYVEDGEPVSPASYANPLFSLRAVTTATIAVGQPGTFYTEMITDEETLQALVLAAATDAPLAQTVSEWIATLADGVIGGVGDFEYRALAAVAPVAPASIDPLLEPVGKTVTISRRTCTAFTPPATCTVYSPWADAFSVTLADHTFPWKADITPYETGLGNAFVEGNLAGGLTIAAEHDVVVTDNLLYATDEAILGLVAEIDVAIYHPVSCRTTLPVTAPGGTCPDDISGLYVGGFGDSDFDAFHPSRRYKNLRSDLDSIEVHAAILARQGSMLVQNYMRGPALGALSIKGGVYQRHRGATGVDWEALIDSPTRERSGYRISMQYDTRVHDQPPPSFAEPDEAGDSGAWQLLGVSERLGDD